MWRFQLKTTYKMMGEKVKIPEAGMWRVKSKGTTSEVSVQKSAGVEKILSRNSLDLSFRMKHQAV